MTALEVEVILKTARLGYWNYKLLMCLVIILLFNAYYLMFFPFVYGELNYKCIDNQVLWNNSHHQCYTKVEGKIVKCQKFSYSPGKDFQETAVEKFNLVCDKRERIRWDLSCLLIGEVFSTIFSSMLFDYFGRKRILQIFTFLCIIVSTSYLFQPNFYLMCLSRIIGSFLGLSKDIGMLILATEVLPIKYARHSTSILTAVVGTGCAMTSVFSMIFPKWKDFIFYRIILLDIIMFILTIFFLEESPKWLLQKKRYKEFKELIERMFKQNKTEMPQNLRKILEDIQHQQTQSNKKKTFSNLMSFFSGYKLVKTRKTAFRMFCLSLSWITVVVIYYALAFGKDLFDFDLHIYYIINGLSEIPGAITQMAFTTYFGYRMTNFLSLTACAACLFLNHFLKIHSGLIMLTYLNAACTKLLTMTVMMNVYTWNAQLVPTDLRGIGMGLGSFIGRLVGIPMPIVFSYLKNTKPYLPGVTMGIFALIAAVFSLPLPETKGHVPPDNIEEFEALGTKNYDDIKRQRIEMLKK